jgi:hypothetical protein
LPRTSDPFRDPRLEVDGIVAVPDLTGAGTGLTLARKARRREFDGATVVRCDDDPAVLVPRLMDAAARAGYRWLVAPWSPDPSAPPETVHCLYLERV